MGTDPVRPRAEMPYLEERCRGYVERVMNAMGACSAEGLDLRRTGRIKIFVGRDVALDFKAWGRTLDQGGGMISFEIRYPNPDQVGILAGLDLIEDDRLNLHPAAIVLRYEITV